MKIVTVSIIRNEADIIETFVRHHLQIVDHMIIVNHRSVDSSKTILERLRDEGLHIELFEETSLEHVQGQVLTRMMRRAACELDADWVMPLDADEFVTASGSGRVRDTLARQPQDQVIKVPWRTYVPLSTDSESETNVLKRIKNCRVREMPQYYKVCVPAPFAREKHATLVYGSHLLLRKTFSRQNEFPSVNTDGLALAHFPVRARNQLLSKAISVWLSSLAKRDKRPNENTHVKQLFDRFKQGDKFSPEELTMAAVGYASDMSGVDMKDALTYRPVVPEGGDFALQYTKEYECNPLAVLATLGEEFAQAYGIFRRNHICIHKPMRKKRVPDG